MMESGRVGVAGGSAATQNRYFVNSEGTVVRSGQNLYEMYISCSTQAADGTPQRTLEEQITICPGGRDPREFSANPSARCPSDRERRQTPAAKLKNVMNPQAARTPRRRLALASSSGR